MTATPKKLLRELEQRDGHRCAWTGYESDRLVPHHRQNRGMGGRPSVNRLSNLVWLDSGINGLIESDPEWQSNAIVRGIKVSTHGNPLLIPIQHAVHGLVWLDDQGGTHDGTNFIPF